MIPLHFHNGVPEYLQIKKTSEDRVIHSMKHSQNACKVVSHANICLQYTNVRMILFKNMCTYSF